MLFLAQHVMDSPRRLKIIEGSIDMPAVESGEVQILCIGDSGFVERLVVWMFQCDVSQALELLHEPVTDYLDLRLVRDCFEIGMQNAALCIQRFAVPIA